MSSISYIRRNIDDVLVEWKTSSFRKVLLLRGARQTGKTSTIRHFAKGFESFVEINFEEMASAARIFEGDLDVREICDRLSAFVGTPIVPGKTLLFFYERMPDLHVVAAA